MEEIHRVRALLQNNHSFLTILIKRVYNRDSMTMKKCSVEGCAKNKRRNGPKTLYCDMHYRRNSLTGSPGEASSRKVFSYKDQSCRVVVCSENAKKKGLCVKHYDDSRGSSLSAEMIAEMKEGGCQVCGSFSRLTLDHDHSCCPVGKSCDNCVRGILCHKCNTAAGLLDDDVSRMFSLAEYLIMNKVVANV